MEIKKSMIQKRVRTALYKLNISNFQEVQTLISAILEKNPEKRFNLTQILDSTWMKLNQIKSPDKLVFD